MWGLRRVSIIVIITVYHLGTMDRWTGEQRGFAVKAYFQNDESFIQTRRVLRRHFKIPRNQLLTSDNAIRTQVNNLKQTGSTTKNRGGSAKTVQTPENIERVRQAIQKNPHRSALRHVARLAMNDRSVRRILHLDIHFHPYKIQIVQSLNPGDYQKRIRFCKNTLGRLEENDDQINNLWMSDEAHFHLSGFVNKQNFRYWSYENPRLLHETPLHSQKVIIWCVISANGIIGPFFFFLIMKLKMQ